MSHEKNTEISDLREMIGQVYLQDEASAVENLIRYLNIGPAEREGLVEDGAEIVRVLRRSKNPGLMETFLSEYGLSTEEGVALMCLAEALLRVPDEGTIDALIQDKIAPADWSRHLGHSTSPLVNASTWALMLTGKVISPKDTESWDVVGNIRHLMRRAGEPVIRKAVAQSMKILGHQFVLGRNIDEAMKRASAMEAKGYHYSYDMLGEAARTATDAKKYFLAYSRAISRISEGSTNPDVRDNPGISVKLSALHPRYEYTQKSRVMTELVPRVGSLVLQAKNAQMGFNIDAEEADRLDLSLDVIEAVLSEPDLAGWDGFGVVVQAYGPRAFYVLDWCYKLAQRLDRKIMVRLVKGAYWDTEIKNAQVEGLSGYPVFTRKTATDISYMACAKKLLSMTDHIYPQFATHNAHTVATVLKLAKEKTSFEFQRLHGMGEALHDLVKTNNGTRCRIYAPVGVHEDLLAYLVRRLLENGANSSFVNQVLDEKVPARDVVADPVPVWQKMAELKSRAISLPEKIYAEGRINSAGINFANPSDLALFEMAREGYRENQWQAKPTVTKGPIRGEGRKVLNPADLSDEVGTVFDASIDDVNIVMDAVQKGQVSWARQSSADRAEIITRFAVLLEENQLELMALLAREAGKTAFDAIGEIREAVDFCRYYALEAQKMDFDPANTARGIFVCISPWNFPLAIFSGQVVAGLVTGNAVIAKPAEQTPLVASFAVRLMYQAGVPEDVLHLLPGAGSVIGNALVSHPDIGGVCFTGSTATAQLINKAMSENADPFAPLIAETGGLNAMIVDSSALPEQVVGDVIASAFQSSGQRCSALRILYVQEDIAENLLAMLEGALNEVSIGNPWDIQVDAGPLIDAAAHQNIKDYCVMMEKEGRLIAARSLPMDCEGKGHFIAPTIFKVAGIEELEKEVFGPVLHVATYPSGNIGNVVDAINKAGFGLTMGLHTRVDGRVQQVADQAHVGNLYVNRNQIGAVVGVQPFGGEGMSGTGPKAGGPLYLRKFVGKSIDKNKVEKTQKGAVSNGANIQDLVSRAAIAWTEWDKRVDRLTWIKGILPKLHAKTGFDIKTYQNRIDGYDQNSIPLVGPTGESNHLRFWGRGVLLISGENWLMDALVAITVGNAVVISSETEEAREFAACLADLGVPEGVVFVANRFDVTDQIAGSCELAGCCLSVGERNDVRKIRQLLAGYVGPIIPVLQSGKRWHEFVIERTLSVDTTASGGNAALLASVEG